jgi:hypothetical protein
MAMDMVVHALWPYSKEERRNAGEAHMAEEEPTTRIDGRTCGLGGEQRETW